MIILKKQKSLCDGMLINPNILSVEDKIRIKKKKKVPFTIYPLSTQM
jgi:hypothetical protein